MKHVVIRDYHGFSLRDAITDMDCHVGGARLRHAHENFEFIVGHGVIKNEIMRVLRDEYNLKPSIKLGNAGVIVCEVE